MSGRAQNSVRFYCLSLTFEAQWSERSRKKLNKLHSFLGGCYLCCLNHKDLHCTSVSLSENIRTWLVVVNLSQCCPGNLDAIVLRLDVGFWWKRDGTKRLCGAPSGEQRTGPSAESRPQVNCARHKRNKTGIVHVNGRTCIRHMKPVVTERFHFNSTTDSLVPKPTVLCSL